MKSANFNVRGISSSVMARLKKEAEKQHTSVNFLIINLLEKGLGHSFMRKRNTYHELDHLAGTWTNEDLDEFNENIKPFEEIDEDLWK